MSVCVFCRINNTVHSIEKKNEETTDNNNNNTSKTFTEFNILKPLIFLACGFHLVLGVDPTNRHKIIVLVKPYTVDSQRSFFG